MHPKTKLFAVKLRRILEVFRLQGLQEKIPGAFSRFMRPKTKLLAMRLRCILDVLCSQHLQKKSWHIFIIYVSKNEAVGCEVETHFGSYLLAKYTEKILGTFS